ncbi:MAG: putative DNA modification/repair radical SAM protein [Halothermotrichaceae bacterium]
MELMNKLKILADAAKYDVSCSSSGSSRRNKKGGIGNAAVSGICHSWSDDGRCISLLKILFTNECIYNCTYCVNRAGNDIPRASFTPEEVARLTINFYRRNYIEGLFLSSAVRKSSDFTMELLLETVKKLRREYKFNGYIHLKAIPGADADLIEKAGRYADRMSVNIELPSRKSLNLLAPEKKYNDIISPMKTISTNINKDKKRLSSSKSVSKSRNNSGSEGNRVSENKNAQYLNKFVPAGQSTQLIIGASPEPDYHILKLSEGFYQKFNMKRVYYSAYIPVNEASRLPVLKRPPLLREHRLYQADWLLRFYNFSADELLDKKNPNFDINLDPKANWAVNNLGSFPVEINSVSYQQLLRVPGIGVKSARRIIASRQKGTINFEHLKKFGTVLKRAKYFITCDGKYFGGVPLKEELLRNRLAVGDSSQKKQLSLFADYSNVDNNFMDTANNIADKK